MIQITITYHCHTCGSTNIVRNGANKCGSPQYYCKECGAYRVLEPKRIYPEDEKELYEKNNQSKSKQGAKPNDRQCKTTL